MTEFFFEAAHMPACLLRDELWVARVRDWTMKTDLLRMLEWQAATRGVEAGYAGKGMARWTEQRNWLELHDVFGRFDPADSWRALMASIELFRRVAQEVAARTGFTYPQETDGRVTTYLSSFSGRIP